ncbi:MAG: hypothetical protein V4538_16180 [Bacteroidota bacterium]
MKTTAIVLLSLFSLSVTAQSYSDQRGQLLFYNVAINGAIGGVSELITNPRHVTHSKAFLHGFRNGAIGGAVIAGTKMGAGYMFTNEINYLAWTMQFTDALGTSIVYNTSRSSKFLEYYNVDLFGLVRLETNTKTRKIKPYALPFGIGALAVTAFTKGNSFNFENTLYTLTPCFTTTNKTTAFSTNLVSSITVSNGVKPSARSEALSHEFIHMLQYRDYLNINNIVFGDYNKYIDKTGPFKYIYMDLPYFGAAYGLNDLALGRNHYYYKNFFEFEAESFASGSFVKRNF